MNKVVLFDIDGTLFDPKLFLENFYKRLVGRFKLISFDEDRLKHLYLESKVHGYFKPELFLPEILKHMEIKDEKALEGLFWDQSAIDECLYQDSTVVEAIGNLAIPAIFSTGDSKYQRIKVERFKRSISHNNIFVYENKVRSFGEVLEKFPEFKIYLIDDRLEIIEELKAINPDSFAILINRQNFEAKSDKIDALVGNLYEILPLLDE
jgi:FMN phosphatase YigB (HAD superfamily)